MIRIKRVYREPSPMDGVRILIDRMRPRGISKERAHVVEWRKDVAPSTSLRTWFRHDPAKWNEFRRQYRTELTRSGMMEALKQLARLSPKMTITLVYSAADEEHNQAVALKEWLDELSRRAHGSHDVTA